MRLEIHSSRDLIPPASKPGDLVDVHIRCRVYAIEQERIDVTGIGRPPTYIAGDTTAKLIVDADYPAT